MGLVLDGGCEMLLGGLDANAVGAELDLTRLQIGANDRQLPDGGRLTTLDLSNSLIQIVFSDEHFSEEVKQGHNESFFECGLITRYVFFAK